MKPTWIVGVGMLLTAAQASAQPDTDHDPVAIVEVGVAPNWSVSNADSTVSPTVAVEFTPIENWLEIEIGTTPTFASHSTQWDTDFLFKKPWTLSKKLEVMAGVGPSWIHSSRNGAAVNSLAGDAILDFMFWPTAKRRYGWYIEPAYEYDFARGHEQSIGFSIGLLIPIRW